MPFPATGPAKQFLRSGLTYHCQARPSVTNNMLYALLSGISHRDSGKDSNTLNTNTCDDSKVQKKHCSKSNGEGGGLSGLGG